MWGCCLLFLMQKACQKRNFANTAHIARGMEVFSEKHRASFAANCCFFAKRERKRCRDMSDSWRIFPLYVLSSVHGVQWDDEKHSQYVIQSQISRAFLTKTPGGSGIGPFFVTSHAGCRKIFPCQFFPKQHSGEFSTYSRFLRDRNRRRHCHQQSNLPPDVYDKRRYTEQRNSSPRNIFMTGRYRALQSSSFPE